MFDFPIVLTLVILFQRPLPLKCESIHNAPPQVDTLLSIYTCTTIDTFQRTTSYPVGNFNTSKFVHLLEPKAHDIVVGVTSWGKHDEAFYNLGIFLRATFLYERHTTYSPKTLW